MENVKIETLKKIARQIQNGWVEYLGDDKWTYLPSWPGNKENVTTTELIIIIEKK